MRRTFPIWIWLVAAVALGCGDNGGSSSDNFFTPKPECEGEAVASLMGQHKMIMSSLAIGEDDEGFDLDGDGVIDNKMSAIGGLAREPLEDSFKDDSVVIPLEFFDLDTVEADECVKFAFYAGAYHLDEDGDVWKTVESDGDCNDHDAQVGPFVAEVADNGKDDDCDGLADEVDGTPSTNTDDADGDGVTIADGDCDDTNPAVLGPDSAEVCGDGFDNDCDGVADRHLTDPEDDTTNVCSPYDDDLEDIHIEPYSYDDNGDPVVVFNNGSITDVDGTLRLEAGPSRFSVTVPLDDSGDLNLELRISGARIAGDMKMTPGGWGIENGVLAGVLGANSLDKITGLSVDEVGLTPEDTLLDATYANILGTLLALKRLGGESEYADCQTPDIDVDSDGIEAFCDTDPTDDVKRVDACVDGDGTVVFDETDADGNVTAQCTAAEDDDGNIRFVDGISITLTFETVPATF